MVTNHDAKSGIKKGGDKVSNALLDAVATNVEAKTFIDWIL
jgi:hypothetical protein